MRKPDGHSMVRRDGDVGTELTFNSHLSAAEDSFKLPVLN